MNIYQKGFMPIIILLLVAVITASSTIVVKNLTLDQPQATPDKGFRYLNKPSASPKPASASVSPTKQVKNNQTSAAKASSTPITIPAGSTSSQTTISTSTPSPTTSPVISSTTGSISGTVKDSNGNPIPGASLELRCCIVGTNNYPSHFATSDSNGRFSFSGLPAYSDYSLNAYYQGINNSTRLNVAAGQDTNGDITVSVIASPTAGSPQITGLSPTTQFRGSNIDILGSNFGTTRESVYFKTTYNGQLSGSSYQANIISWANDKITVQVPYGDYTTAKVFVSVVRSDGFVTWIDSGDLTFTAR